MRSSICFHPTEKTTHVPAILQMTRAVFLPITKVRRNRQMPFGLVVSQEAWLREHPRRHTFVFGAGKRSFLGLRGLSAGDCGKIWVARVYKGLSERVLKRLRVHYRGLSLIARVLGLFDATHGSGVAGASAQRPSTGSSTA